MSLPQNEHLIDRLLRIFIGTALLQVGYFWFGGLAAIVLICVGLITLTTGLIGFCPLYKLFSLDTRTLLPTPTHTNVLCVVFGILYATLIIGGSYASIFFSNKFFLENFNAMDNAYKQTLFHTGQGDRDTSISDYQALVSSFGAFSTTYATYRPHTLRHDAQFSADLAAIDETIRSLADTTTKGDLYEAHLALETVRPILQDILKRNGFSLLAVALIDFHDAMELVLTPADEKDSAGVLAAYPEADAKLRAVEQEANDAEIQTIRNELETIRQMAEDGNTDALPEQAAKLKSSFVKVYLARG